MHFLNFFYSGLRLTSGYYNLYTLTIYTQAHDTRTINNTHLDTCKNGHSQTYKHRLGIKFCVPTTKMIKLC